MTSPSEEKPNVGLRLREERERLGLGQLDLAGPAGVTRNTQWAYEKGERAPDAWYLATAASLGVDVLYVVTGTRAGAASLEGPRAELLSQLDRLEPAHREAIEVLVRALSGGQPAPAIGIGSDPAAGSRRAGPDIDLALWRSVALSIPGTPDLDGNARLTAEQWLEIVDGGYRLAQRNAADRRTAEQDAAKVLKKAREG